MHIPQQSLALAADLIEFCFERASHMRDDETEDNKQWKISSGTITLDINISFQ